MKPSRLGFRFGLRRPTREATQTVRLVPDYNDPLMTVDSTENRSQLKPMTVRIDPAVVYA